MFIPGILDPNFFHPGFHICIIEFNYFNPKKWFLSSRKYDSGCLSHDPDPGSLFFTRPGPRVQESKRHQIPDPQHWISIKKASLSLQPYYLGGEIAEEVLQAVLHVVGQPARHPV
jgi:hypothetical protein